MGAVPIRVRWERGWGSEMSAPGSFLCRRQQPRQRQQHPYCTFAVTKALPVIVSGQVRVLLPPLEQAPDQITSRPFVALRVMAVPVANEARPLLPTETLMPAGLEVIRSPLRPVAVTVSAPVCTCGITVRPAVRITPAALAVSVTGVDAATALVWTAKVVLVDPAATKTLAGTAAAALLLDSETTSLPPGAADVNVTALCETAPPRACKTWGG
jgi:hypothetical protein